MIAEVTEIKEVEQWRRMGGYHQQGEQSQTSRELNHS